MSGFGLARLVTIIQNKGQYAVQGILHCHVCDTGQYRSTRDPCSCGVCYVCVVTAMVILKTEIVGLALWIQCIEMNCR